MDAQETSAAFEKAWQLVLEGDPNRVALNRKKQQDYLYHLFGNGNHRMPELKSHALLRVREAFVRACNEFGLRDTCGQRTTWFAAIQRRLLSSAPPQ